MLYLKVTFSVMFKDTLLETGQPLCPQFYKLLLDTSYQQYGNTVAGK